MWIKIAVICSLLAACRYPAPDGRAEDGLQKTVFCITKGHVLHHERPCFAP